MVALNGEGIQKEKVPFFDFIEKGCRILDLGSGITVPYSNYLLTRSPSEIVFLDNRFDKSDYDLIGMMKIRGDAFDYLQKNNFDYIWASEFIEHVDPDRQEELFNLIKDSCKYYIITFPSTEHFNFHNDPDHRPVIIPQYNYKVNKRDWEGIITNIEGIINHIKSNYEWKYLENPPKIISKKRELEGLGI